MAPKAKPAVDTIEKKGPTSQEVMGQFLQDNKTEHFNFVTPKNTPISTGSLILDSLVTIRSGGVTRLNGKGAELGKSSEAFVLADNFMKTMPKAKTVYYKAEGRLTPEIIARTNMRFVFTAEEWVEGTVLVFSANIFEVIAENLEMIIPQMFAAGEHLCVIIDSMDGLVLRADRAKAMWTPKGGDPKVAGVPKLTKELFRRLGLMITHYDVLMCITGQYSAAISLSAYAPTEHRQTDSSGGNSVAHQSDYVFEYMPRFGGDQILENPDEKPDYQKNKTMGVYATIVIKKSATDVTGTRVKIPIKKGRKGCAIWIEREIVELMLGWELLVRSGSWMSIDAGLRSEIETATTIKLPEKVQGLDKVYALLESEPKVVSFLFAKFSSLIAAGTA